MQRVFAHLDDSTDDMRPNRPSADQPMPTSPIGMTVHPLKLEGRSTPILPPPTGEGFAVLRMTFPLDSGTLGRVRGQHGRRSMKHSVWLPIIGLMVIGMAAISCGGSDSETQFSLLLPSGWVDDTEFGKVIMAETAGDEWADNVKFAGGKSIVGGYEPNVFVLSIAVPRGTGLEELVDEEIRQIRAEDSDTELIARELILIDGIPAEEVIFRDPPDFLYPQGVELVQIYLLRDKREWVLQCTAGRELIARELILIDGIPAEEVIFRDPPDFLYPQGVELVQIYLLRDKREWVLQCTAGRELIAELQQCKEALYTFLFLN